MADGSRGIAPLTQKIPGGVCNQYTCAFRIVAKDASNTSRILDSKEWSTDSVGCMSVFVRLKFSSAARQRFLIIEKISSKSRLKA